MGWKSTLYITKEDAVQLIVKNILSADDDLLENILDELGEKSGSGFFGHNAKIVNDYDDLNENNYYMYFGEVQP
jgi:hypothetical protein